MKYILFFLLASLTITALGQTDSPAQEIKAKIITSDELKSFNEKEAYKMLYENQVASNSAILNTIFYALGGLGAAILFVFASNWWFNDKKVKELIKEIDTKVQNIKDEIYSELSERLNSLSIEKNKEISDFQNKVQADINTNLLEITKQFKDFSDSLNAEIKKDNKDLLANYQKQLDSFNLNYNQQISTLNDNIKSTLSSIKESLQDKEELLKELINSEKQSRLSENQNLMEKVLRNEAWMWEGRNVPNNTLNTELEELELKISSGSDLTFYLDGILRTSKKLTWLLDSDKKSIRNHLNRVPEKYISKVEEIMKVVENVKEF